MFTIFLWVVSARDRFTITLRCSGPMTLCWIMPNRWFLRVKRWFYFFLNVRLDKMAARNWPLTPITGVCADRETPLRCLLELALGLYRYMGLCEDGPRIKTALKRSWSDHEAIMKWSWKYMIVFGMYCFACRTISANSDWVGRVRAASTAYAET